ncbi:MAG: serine hydrolase [Bacteroidetes bacterium]|nr:serine hydrolase [Bacteroidota bacterium]
MKTIILSVLIIFLTGAVVAQQTDPPGNEPVMYFKLHQPNQVGLNKRNTIRTDELKPATSAEIQAREPSQTLSFDPAWASRFQTVLDSVRNATGVKGLSAAVLVPGMGTWTGVSGIAGTGIPMTTDRRFGIASNTKLFIAVTLAKLQQQGVLSLDDHLYQWLPFFPNVDSSATIRQLLSHESGVFDFWNDNISGFWNLILADTSHFFTPEEMLGTIGAPKFAPGHGFKYSNTGYLLAGMVIEAATGHDYTMSLHDVIFDPLTMDSTFVGAVESKNGPVAHEWVWSLGEVAQSPMTSGYSAVSTSANILSLPGEMTEWYSRLFGGNLLPDSVLAELLKIEPTSTYGLGIFDLESNGHKFYDHNGSMIGDLSEMIYDKQTKSVFCIMTNSRENFDFGNILIPMMNVLWNECPKKLNDAGITKVLSPWENGCTPSVTPTVTLQNFASQPMTSVSIHYKIDEDPVSNHSWTGSLGSGASVNVTLPAIAAGSGQHSFTCFTSAPNGNPEGYNYNDTAKSRFIVNTSAAATVPFTESFDGEVFPPDGWSLNSSSVYSWGRTSLAKFSGTYSAVKANYQDYSYRSWDINLPLLNLGNQSNTTLSFTYSYARYPNRSDSLIVSISADCGTSWQTLFNKGGTGLITAPSTTQLFFPQTPDQWKTEEILLSDYTGNVLIKFRDVSGNGNNLYLDDVSVNFPTGMAVNKSPESFVAYPNPACDVINVSGLPVNSEVKIMNLTGKELLTHRTINSTSSIDIRNLTQGVYILRSTSGVKKIVKM